MVWCYFGKLRRVRRLMRAPGRQYVPAQGPCAHSATDPSLACNASDRARFSHTAADGAKRRPKRADKWNIFKDDGLSGATTKGPALHPCLKKLEHRDMLIVWKLDRLGLSLRDLITMLDDLAQK